MARHRLNLHRTFDWFTGQATRLALPHPIGLAHLTCLTVGPTLPDKTVWSRLVVNLHYRAERRRYSLDKALLEMQPIQLDAHLIHQPLPYCALSHQQEAGWTWEIRAQLDTAYLSRLGLEVVTAYLTWDDPPEGQAPNDCFYEVQDIVCQIKPSLALPVDLPEADLLAVSLSPLSNPSYHLSNYELEPTGALELATDDRCLRWFAAEPISLGSALLDSPPSRPLPNRLTLTLKMDAVLAQATYQLTIRCLRHYRPDDLKPWEPMTIYPAPESGRGKTRCQLQ